MDQVDVMETLVNSKGLRDRILVWKEEEIQADRLPAKSNLVIEAVLYRGKLLRGEVVDIFGTSDRHARRDFCFIGKRSVGFGVYTSTVVA